MIIGRCSRDVPSVRVVARAGAAGALLLVLLAAGCGKKGPPLAPLREVPAAVGEVAARRTADEVRLSFAIPSTYANAPGRVELDRIEIFAITLGPGVTAPPPREWTAPERRVGTIAVKPPAEDGAAVDPKDQRPAAGDKATFVERLTPDLLRPVPVLSSGDPATPAKPPAQGETAAAPAPTATRLYALRAVTRRNRPGAFSPAVAVPLVDPPAPPSGVTARHTEAAVVLQWTPPATPADLPPSFNVYRPGAEAVPLNAAAVTTATFEQAGVVFGEEQCFVVRSVVVAGGVPIEGDASTPACITARDVFPPAAPSNLTAIASDGAMNLAWDANTEKDLAGYLVLRGEGAGATLQQLTPEPVRENTYRDVTVKPGVTYVYAIVAIDTATPPNVSAQSAQRTETAR